MAFPRSHGMTILLSHADSKRAFNDFSCISMPTNPRLPSLPAASCKNLLVIGNDGRLYYPVQNKAGVWSWRSNTRPKEGWRISSAASTIVARLRKAR